MVLTHRQREVLHWIASGLQQKEVAVKMGAAVVTIHKLIHRACDANQCVTLPQLMAKAGQYGVFLVPAHIHPEDQLLEADA